MNTPFYDTRYRRPFPFTLLLLERMETLHQRGELDTASALRELCEVPEDEMPEALAYVEGRLFGHAKAGPSAQPSRRVKSLGHALTSLLGDLPLHELLIVAFGLREARRLYCEEDMDDALLSLRLWQDEQVGRHIMAWEATLYGFGGRYKDDGEQSASVIDMTTDEGFEALKSFAQQVNGVFH
jgi:hypothetical protein